MLENLSTTTKIESYFGAILGNSRTTPGQEFL